MDIYEIMFVSFFASLSAIYVGIFLYYIRMRSRMAFDKFNFFFLLVQGMFFSFMVSIGIVAINDMSYIMVHGAVNPWSSVESIQTSMLYSIIGILLLIILSIVSIFVTFQHLARRK